VDLFWNEYWQHIFIGNSWEFVKERLSKNSANVFRKTKAFATKSLVTWKYCKNHKPSCVEMFYKNCFSELLRNANQDTLGFARDLLRCGATL